MSMRPECRAVVVALLAVVPAMPLLAHHSVPAVFDEGKQLVLTGTISKIDWINPHIHLFLTTKEADGKATTWEIETLPTNWMRNAGITKDAVFGNAAAGEVVTSAITACFTAASCG